MTTAISKRRQPLTKSHFKFYAPTSVRKSRDAKGNEEMLIAGICSAECLDRDREIAFQKGLDFRPFLGRQGAFNIDHDNQPGNIVGVGKSVRIFKAGQTLPDGSKAQYNLSWVEGALLNTRKGREIFETCRELGKFGKSLYLSVEGSVLERAGSRQHILSKAEIERIAVTSRPVCEETSLMTKDLATRLLRASKPPAKPLGKSMSAMGADGQTPNVLMRQDLAGRITNMAMATSRYQKRRKQAQGAQKSRLQSVLLNLYKAAPSLSVDTAIDLAREHLKSQSRKGN